MKRFGLLFVAFLLAIPACASGQAASGPASQPETTAVSEPATTQCSTENTPDATVLAILQGLEKASQVHPTIRADIDYTVENADLGDTETRTGWLGYQDGGEKASPKVRIHFDTLRQNEGKNIAEKKDYAFDGQWGFVSTPRIKQMNMYQYAGQGEVIQPLKLGRSPFPPLPFGQKVDDVLKYFVPTTRPVAADEPQGTLYLKLVTRPQQKNDINITYLEMWIDPASHIPVKVISQDRSRNVTTIVLGNVKTNITLEQNIFSLTPGPGWTVHRETVGEQKQ